jgi:hypothetical protein
MRWWPNIKPKCWRRCRTRHNVPLFKQQIVAETELSVALLLLWHYSLSSKINENI